MDLRSLTIGAALLLIGYLIGRFTASGARKTVVYQAHARSRDRSSTTALETGHAEIDALLRAGQKIHAIKRHRELYGTGLKEAKDAIDALSARPR